MSKMYTLHIANPPEAPCLDWIESGKKPVEGRPYSKKYRAMKPGDQIKFVCDDRVLVVRVTRVSLYRTLKEYLEKEKVSNALPGVKSVSEGIKVYNMWTTPEKRAHLRKETGYAFMGIGIGIGID